MARLWPTRHTVWETDRHWGFLQHSVCKWCLECPELQQHLHYSILRETPWNLSCLLFFNLVRHFLLLFSSLSWETHFRICGSLYLDQNYSILLSYHECKYKPYIPEHKLVSINYYLLEEVAGQVSLQDALFQPLLGLWMCDLDGFWWVTVICSIGLWDSSTDFIVTSSALWKGNQNLRFPQWANKNECEYPTALGIVSYLDTSHSSNQWTQLSR